MSNLSELLPNPLTPMAFLPPDLAYQVTISIYVLVGSVSVLVWDIVTNLQADFKMVKKHPISISMVAYFLSRISSLVYLTGVTLSQTSPLGHCENVQRIQALYPIVIPTTSLLFFFRVRAMYMGNNLVIGFFFFMWLAVVGASITPIVGLSGSSIGTTQYCINTRLENYVAAACIIPFVNDTLIFCATSWQLMQNAHVEDGVRNGVKVIIFGRHLPAFSRSILQDGQAYYLSIISLNLVTASLFFNSSISIVYRSFVGVPNIVLMNSMACHVYRNIRLGIYREFPTGNPTMPTTMHGRGARSTAIAFNGRGGTATSVQLGQSIETRGGREDHEVELDRMSTASLRQYIKDNSLTSEASETKSPTLATVTTATLKSS